MAHFSIHLTDPIATINPNIYGHFAEHLGRCIYDGIWVGEESKITNLQGFRTDVIEALRRMKAPIIRWPGGCFADDYHWQDGIGPREQRPRRINIHWGEVVESNAVGTQEFVAFCKLVGAQPYFCGNVGSGSPRELRDWVEYCNFPGDSSWAQQRAKDGSPEPLGVTYWGIGNENWGCGGNFSPEDYCTEFRRFGSFVRGFGQPLYNIACGPSGNDVRWTNRFFEKLMNDYWAFNNIHGYAAHYYCGTGGTATEYSTDQWYQLLANGLKMEALVVQQRAAMDAYDPQRRIGLIVDEWGTWHPVEEGTNRAFLYQQNSLRDALVAAATLDIFNRHADKVVMSNIAQMVNVLQAMILTREDQMLVTPTGLVYELYAPHQGATALRMLAESESVSFQRGNASESLALAAGSASLKDNTLFVTLTNSHAADALPVQIDLQGGSALRVLEARSISGEIHAHNTFDQPQTVQAQPLAAELKGSVLHVTLPAASVTALTIQVG